jgi:ABC-type transport system involved in multi-copper enzyme maturation permease subunit
MLALIVTVPPLLAGAIQGLGLAPLGDAYPIALLFAVGMIGQDVSSGVLQLVLARPITRAEYVISRWLSAALAASAASLLQVALGWALLAMRGAAPDAGTVALLAGGRELQIFGVVATLALFSSVMSGVGDLALYVILSIFAGLLPMIGQVLHASALVWIGQELGTLLSPKLDLALLVAASPSWFAIATYASNLTLCLLLAVAAMNRKELSYAAG